jgi:hypothetical protein
MNQTVNPSLRELQRETEQTRQGLTRTVEQLRTSVSETADDLRRRVSPDAIKAEVSQYVRSRGERLVEDITAAARRNPMQAFAVGASLGYPLLRMARAIPLPVLMVGAGLFFAGSKTGESATQKASDLAADLSDEVRRRSNDLSDQVGSSIAAAREFAADAAGHAGEVIAQSADQMRRSATSARADLNQGTDSLQIKASSSQEAISNRARDLKDGVADVVNSATGSAQNLVSDATTAVHQAALSTKDAARDAVNKLREKASDASDRAGKTVFETIEQNPLLVAGVGLLIGGLIASALSRSDIEGDLIGDASSAAKRQAQEAATKGFEAVKGAAGEILENVARQAGAEGLTADGFDTVARDIGQRVRRVAETAVTTTFNPDNTPKSTSDGGDHHG